MKRNEILGLSVLFILAIVLLFKMGMDKKALKLKGVVVLGKLNSSSFGGDAGWDHKFEYKMNERHYQITYNGAIPFFTISDSLIFIKIQRDNPKNCRLIMDVQVPKCFTYSKFANIYWDSIPTCP